MTNVLPFAGVFFARRTATRMLCGLDVLLVFAMYAYRTKRSEGVISPLPLYAALYPFGASVLVYAMLRSAFTTLANGGIEWRSTKYPLELLKRMHRGQTPARSVGARSPEGLCYSLVKANG